VVREPDSHWKMPNKLQYIGRLQDARRTFAVCTIGWPVFSRETILRYATRT